MPRALIEVEYLKGGRRKRMKRIFADTLTKLGVVKVVESENPSAELRTLPAPPSSPIAPIDTKSLESADTDDEDESDESDAAKQPEEAKPARKKRTYKRRDMQAEDLQKK
jgi:hypothetical protein